MPRVDMKPNSDLCFTSLCRAVSQFIEEFQILPTVLHVCIEGIITALDIREEFKMKYFYFTVDRELPIYAWKLTAFKEGEICELYSAGA